MAISKTTVWSAPFKNLLVEVIEVEWEAGSCFEFRVSRDEVGLIESEREYGSQSAAAADAFTWITEEGDEPLNIQAAAPEERDFTTTFHNTGHTISRRQGLFTVTRPGGPSMTFDQYREPFQGYRRFTTDPQDIAKMIELYEEHAGQQQA